MRPNKMKQMWRENKCVTMGWLSVSNGFTAEVMARQGFDALVVDMQHGLTDMANLWPMLQAISQTDTVPVVRVAWNDPATIMKALDFGAYGILVPLINTAADAAKAVAACRYPPVGMRSSGPVRAVHYGGADYLAKANDEVKKGREVLITEHGRPVAKLVPPDPPRRKGVPNLAAFRATMPVFDPPLSTLIEEDREDRV